MKRDGERIARIPRALHDVRLDAVICALPKHVLLLSGYWPIIGTSLALATQDGKITLLVLQDEEELAQQSGADEVRTFQAGRLDRMLTAADMIIAPLRDMTHRLNIDRGRIGYEQGPLFEPSSYVAMQIYGAGAPALLQQAMSQAALVPADDWLARLCSVKTPCEIERIRTVCRIAQAAHYVGAQQLRAGLQEVEAA